ncbi:IucA/IucC family protein [Legionella waltersii]|uniref:FrgA protein n=1 Tax=Legionella waltersii TaxID=66969 RepID=A0A0W1A4J2_9GAMM|nr:IucA/IucC family protein [Legionella waltersii]KTD76279.1 FrgA protein [Legionella waltersii]SNV13371.1 siderophore biosynthetic protein, iron repressed FrgA [Legionella waltersii]
MALAYGNFHELSHQLRFLLFEIGIGLPQNSIDYFITLAHKNTLNRMQQAVMAEKLCDSTITSHHIHDFVDLLQFKLKSTIPESQFYQWNNLSEQLTESIANEALGLAYLHNWNTKLVKELQGYDSLWQWLYQGITASEALLFLEQWSSYNEAYMPTSFAKKGYTRREILQTSPGFQAKIRVHWCALHKSVTEAQPNVREYDQFIKQAFAKEHLIWREKIMHQRLSPDEYYPIPVHPLQWRKELQITLAPLIDAKLVLLHPNHQSLLALSQEYLLPPNESRYLLKLASQRLNPEERNIDDQFSTYQSLNCILKDMDNYQNSLYLNDPFTELKLRDTNKQTNMSASLHKNPVYTISTEQRVLPFSSLLMRSPISGKPLLAELIESSQMTPIDYLALYTNTLLFGQLHLMVKHGVTFNPSTTQPLIIVEKDRPQGIMIRTLDGLQLNSNPELKGQVPSAAFVSQAIKNDCLRFVESNVLNNLDAWVRCINEYFQIPQKQLWTVIKDRLTALFEQLSKDIDPKLLSQYKHSILTGDWQQECLLQRSLSPIKNRSMTLKIPNYFDQF